MAATALKTEVAWKTTKPAALPEELEEEPDDEPEELAEPEPVDDDDEPEVDDKATEVDDEAALHWYESPSTADFCLLKESQSKSSDDSISIPPETLFNDGNEALVKLPTKITAPPTVSNESKPSISFKLVLFEISKPPPIEVKFDKSISSNSSFETKVNEPPTVPKLAISIDSNEVLMKPNEALTVSNFDKEIEEISRKVMLLAHSKSSNETSTSLEL